MGKKIGFKFPRTAALGFLQAVCTSSRFRRARNSIRHGLKAIRGLPYTNLVHGAAERFLILGDSTMYGLGVKKACNTFGGLLHRKYPHASIETRARCGAKTRDLSAQLERARHRHYEMILVGVGGNDVMDLRSGLSDVGRHLAAFLEAAGKRAGLVVLSHCANLGNTGAFRPPLSYLYSLRSRKLSRLFAAASRSFGNVVHVDFYRPLHRDHYTKETRGKFLAGDGFHPSDHANQYFFGLIWDRLMDFQRGLVDGKLSRIRLGRPARDDF